MGQGPPSNCRGAGDHSRLHRGGHLGEDLLGHSLTHHLETEVAWGRLGSGGLVWYIYICKIENSMGNEFVY